MVIGSEKIMYLCGKNDVAILKAIQSTLFNCLIPNWTVRDKTNVL